MPETILIIDDEPNLSYTLALIFRRRGYNVATAASGKEALEFVRSHSPDLAFLDLKMPDIYGLNLLPSMLDLHPSLPVLILTALVSVERAQESIRCGARGYLLKPIDPESVILLAENLLKEQRFHRIRSEARTELNNLHKKIRANPAGE